MKAFNLSWEEYQAYGLDKGLVSSELLGLLNYLNEYTDNRLYVHCLFDDERKPTNLHYRGLAADGHIRGMSIIDQFVCISRFPFKGIGLYPAWNNPGFHVDLRDAKVGARWGCKEKGEYVALDRAFFVDTLQQEGEDW